MGTIVLRLADAAALRGAYEQHLSKGRAFVPDAVGVREREACELVIEHAGRAFVLCGEAVFLKADGPGRGVGLQLAPLDAATKAALSAFVDGAVDAAPPADPAAQAAADAASDDTAAEEVSDDPAAEEASDDAGDSGGERAPKTVFDRIRGLTAAEQQRVATNGTMQERIVLERTFGANVWEALLANARLTIPEVARIARKGTLPRKLVEDIAAHASWVAAPEVQRALLANPRSTAPVIAKVLRSLTRGDLQLVPQQTAYPAPVRAAAKKLLGGG